MRERERESEHKDKFEFIYEDECYPDNAIAFSSTWDLEHIEYVAQDVAEHIYNDDPTTEYFPIKVEIFVNGESVGVFELCAEPVLSFSAWRIYHET